MASLVRAKRFLESKLGIFASLAHPTISSSDEELDRSWVPIKANTLFPGDVIHVWSRGVSEIQLGDTINFRIRWGAAGVGPILWEFEDTTPDVNTYVLKVQLMVRDATTIVSGGTFYRELASQVRTQWGNSIVATVDMSQDTNLTLTSQVDDTFEFANPTEVVWTLQRGPQLVGAQTP